MMAPTLAPTRPTTCSRVTRSRRCRMRGPMVQVRRILGRTLEDAKSQPLWRLGHPLHPTPVPTFQGPRGDLPESHRIHPHLPLAPN